MGRRRRNNPLRIKFVVVRKQSKHPVHQMSWLLVSGERERDQGLELLIIVQHVEHDVVLLENSIRISCRRGADQVQDLRGHLLGKKSYPVVELGLAYCHVPDRELSVRLSKPDFSYVWPEIRQLYQDVSCQRNWI